ncbi:MAG: type II secretion system F family protein [bacterium]|jgi:type II secretory pathway component PulF
MAKFKWDNLIFFVEQLSSATALKLPVSQTVRNMSLDSPDPKWREVQESVSELVELGSPLSDAMGNYPDYFPTMLRRMVRAGEEGNVLSAMLSSTSRYLQNTREVQQHLRKSIIYPFLVWLILLIDFAIVFFFVIPKIVDMYQNLGLQNNLSWFTLFFINQGPMLFVFVLGLLFFLAWVLLGLIGAEVEGESRRLRSFDRLLSHTPFLGTLQRHARASQVCEMLGIMIKGGHSGPEAIAIAKNNVSNSLLQHALEDVEAALTAEQSSSLELQKKILIPYTTLWMLSQSNGSPQLGDTLLHMADFHQRQLQIQTALIREIIEPLLLLVVALVCALGVVSIYFPIQMITSNII